MALQPLQAVAQGQGSSCQYPSKGSVPVTPNHLSDRLAQASPTQHLYNKSVLVTVLCYCGYMLHYFAESFVFFVSQTRAAFLSFFNSV